MDYLDEKMMKRAIALAKRGIGKTVPNPAVGCVIVKDGVIVGEGWHKKAGTPHAEVNALRQAGEMARGADVYVTLEPCAHFGKTPPCVDALIAAKVSRVYIGMVDPNPKVCGEGILMLRTAGIEVVDSVLEDNCRSLNEPFIKHMITGLPFVILKSAMTLDGKTATASKDSKWVTSDKSRQYVHKLRARLDAIMVGVGTVIADDPLLTSRIPAGKDPLRVIVDSSLRIPLSSHVLHVDSSAKTVLATISDDEVQIARIMDTGAEVLRCRQNNGCVDLHDLFVKLGELGVQSLLLEGGGKLAGEALRCGLIDKCMFFYAPKVVGGEGIGPFSGKGAELMVNALTFKNISIKKIGSDILVQGYPEYACLQV